MDITNQTNPDLVVTGSIDTNKKPDGIVTESLKLAHWNLWQFIKYWIISVLLIILVVIFLKSILAPSIVTNVVYWILNACFSVWATVFIISLVKNDWLTSLDTFAWFKSKNINMTLNLFLWTLLLAIPSLINGYIDNELASIWFFWIIVVPMFYISYKVMLFPFYILSENMWCIDAMKKSYAKTEWKLLKILWTQLLFVLLILGCVFTLWIGLIWAIPASMIWLGLIWKRIEDNTF